MSRWPLAARLALAMALVASVAVLVATLVARQQARDELRGFFSSAVLDEDLERIDAFVAANDGFDGILPLLVEIAEPFDERIVVVDEDGTVVADTAPAEPMPDLDELFGDVVFVDEDGRETELFTLGRAETVAGELAALDRAFAWSAAVALVAALLGGVLVARRLARPLTALRTGVERVAAGDLATRVTPAGPPEVRAVAAAVNDLATSLDDALRQRDAQTADVAHELRGPLANLRAYVEGMVDGVATPGGDDLAVVHAEVLRLQGLVDDLQQLSLAEAGTLRLARTPTDLAGLARDVVTAAGARADRLGVALVVEAATPVVADVDPDRVTQVLANLVANAIQHAPAGSTVTVGVALADGAAGHARLWVADEGPGIPEAERERVFERLHRLDEARSRGADRTSGTGLGLAIARSLARLHGGDVTAHPRDPAGALLVVDLPLHR